jgi:hypothetical protein
MPIACQVMISNPAAIAYIKLQSVTNTGGSILFGDPSSLMVYPVIRTREVNVLSTFLAISYSPRYRQSDSNLLDLYYDKLSKVALIAS